MDWIITSLAFALAALLLSSRILGWRARTSGRKGERAVARKLRRLRRDGYVILNDLLLPSKEGSTQIDHVAVGPGGIFVIETKNHRGRVSGTRDDREWKERFPGRRVKFYNPLLQNYKHVKAIEEILTDGPKGCVHQIVVFPKGSRIRRVRADEVLSFRELVPYIRRTGGECLTAEQVKEYAGRISGMNITSSKERRRHRRHAARKQCRNRK